MFLKVFKGRIGTWLDKILFHNKNVTRNILSSRYLVMLLLCNCNVLYFWFKKNKQQTISVEREITKEATKTKRWKKKRKRNIWIKKMYLLFAFAVYSFIRFWGNGFSVMLCTRLIDWFKFNFFKHVCMHLHKYKWYPILNMNIVADSCQANYILI